MRTIKFRGKRVDTGDWVYGTPVTYRDGHTAIYDGLLMLYGAEATTLSRNKVDPATVGQFTGLQDKDGVEIYEGDRWSYHYEVGVVYYKDGRFNCTEDYSLHCMAEELEVVSNIHEKK